MICRRASTSTQRRSASQRRAAWSARASRSSTSQREGFTLVYLTDGETPFTLELTCLHDRKERYDLGECEFHLAFTVKDFEAAHRLHGEMGCICYENPDMGIYFIEDPDGYWLEVVPEK